MFCIKRLALCQTNIDVGVSINADTPKRGVYFMEHPNLKWMMTGGTHEAISPLAAGCFPAEANNSSGMYRKSEAIQFLLESEIEWD